MHLPVDQSCRHTVKMTMDDRLRRMHRNTMFPLSTYSMLIVTQLLVFSMLWSSQVVRGQLIGTNICGCQPATYTFTFDFALTCDDNNVEGGPGINATACLTEVRGKDEVPDEELIPVTVQTVQIFELDQNLQVFAQTVRTGTFVDGSNFTYTSIISTITDLEDVASLPRGLQLVITGLNNKEEATVQTYIITYLNECGIFPILTEGQTSGWTIFVSWVWLPMFISSFYSNFLYSYVFQSDLGDPPSTICPAVPSMAPITSIPGTSSPTFSPMTLPSLSPSSTPIMLDAPTRAPSLATFAPVVPETEAPAVPAPVPVPIPIETDAPVDIVPPTCAPIGHGGNGGGKGNGGKGKGGKGNSSGKGDDGGKGSGKGEGSGKGDDGGKGSGKGGDSGKGGKGDDSGNEGKGGKGGGKGDDESSSGKGEGSGIRKKKVYDGKMDKLSTEDEYRRLGTGGIECPEIPDDDYYIGKGKGGGKGTMSEGKGGGGKGTMSEGKGGKGDGGKGMMNGGSGKGGKGNGGKGDSEGMGGKGEETEDGGKGKGSSVVMKKPKDSSSSKMEITRTSGGKGKLMSKEDDIDDDYDDEGKNR